MFRENAEKVSLDVSLIYVFIIYIDLYTFLLFGCTFVCYSSPIQLYQIVLKLNGDLKP